MRSELIEDIGGLATSGMEESKQLEENEMILLCHAGNGENRFESKRDLNEKRSEFIEDVDSWTESRTRSLRGHWGNQVEFFLVIMGYTVGIGSVWRFPFVCSQNGGGAFLIPFFFFLFVSGGPLYYMEVCLGQFTGRSAALAFGFCPLFKGLGFLQVSLAVVVVWYVIIISSWNYYYLYSSFTSVLPWTTCNNSWNTPRCRDQTSISNGIISSNGPNLTALLQNRPDHTTPSFEFFEYKVIAKSSGLEELGSLQPHLVICLVIAWFLTVLAVFKGTKTLGKVVYVTATLPYLLLTVLFVRGLLLEGAADGIAFYVKPNFSYLLRLKTWLEAALQVFYSLGPSWGGVITMASYNKFHQKSFWSSTICVASAGFTSFYNGLVVFTIIGFMANESGTTVEQLATQSGTGLVFVAFPIALSKLPLPHFWSVLFFVTLVTVMFDSIFGMFETVISALVDLFPSRLTSNRVYVNVCTGAFLTVSGLPLCLNGGVYILQILDWYAPRFALLFGSLLQCVALFWIYGTDRFCNDIEMMTGRKTSMFLRVMWSIVTPGFVGVSFVITLTQFSTPDYGDGYVYGPGPLAFGVLVGLMPIIGLLAYGVSVLIRAEGTLKERLRASIKPDNTWRPNSDGALTEYLMKSYRYPSSIKQRLLVDLTGARDSGHL